jgi:hypothetical protein
MLFDFPGRAKDSEQQYDTLKPREEGLHHSLTSGERPGARVCPAAIPTRDF